MLVNHHRYVGAAFLAMGLAFAAQALAQERAHQDAPPAATAAAPQSPHDEWDDEGGFEHQSFREEMEKIRHDHEILDTDEDRFDIDCAAPTADQAKDCDARDKDLHARHKALHERRKALFEKMQTARAAHIKEMARQGVKDPEAATPDALPREEDRKP